MLHYPQNYIDNVSVRFGYHSNAIEGNKLTLSQTQAIMLDGQITATKPETISLRDVYEADNQKDAFSLLLNLVANDAQLSTETILHLHYELTKNTLVTAGDFKQHENRIVEAGFATASIRETPFLVKQWIENTNYQLDNIKDDEEALRSLMDSHIKFERLHPFDDGNGRVGRELINLELAKRNMPFLIIENTAGAKYITFEQANDIDGLVEYAKQQLEKEEKRYKLFEENYLSERKIEY